MDSHIIGPRGGTPKGSQTIPLGAIRSAITVGVKFGDAALSAKEIFRTTGALGGLGYGMPNKKNPIMVVFHGQIVTAFDGSVPSPVFSLTETNLDDSGSVTIAAIANFVAGFFNAYKFLTVDKKYKLTYTIGGAATVGEGYFGITVNGPGYSGIT
jgi:hypothetical protein